MDHSFKLRPWPVANSMKGPAQVHQPIAVTHQGILEDQAAPRDLISISSQDHRNLDTRMQEDKDWKG